MSNDSSKKSNDFTASFSVGQTPDEVFRAINDVRGWWSGQIDGPTDQLGGEFTYRYEDVHYSKHKVTELLPGRRVVWLTVDSRLGSFADKEEWNGTRVVFDISRQGDQTEVRFTHEGLVPSYQCYGACSSAWGSFIRNSLRNRITTGKSQPDALKKHG